MTIRAVPAVTPRHRHPAAARPHARADGREGDRRGARSGAEHGAAHPAGAGGRGAGARSTPPSTTASASGMLVAGARRRWRATTSRRGCSRISTPCRSATASPRSGVELPNLAAHDRGGAVAQPGAGAPACRCRQPLPDPDQRHRPLRRRLRQPSAGRDREALQGAALGQCAELDDLDARKSRRCAGRATASTAATTSPASPSSRCRC